VNVGGGVGKDTEMLAGSRQYKVSAAAASEEDCGAGGTEDADAKKELMTGKDEILTKLLEDCAKPESKIAANISKYYFHEALLEEQEEWDSTLLASMDANHDAGDLKPSSKPIAWNGTRRDENTMVEKKLKAPKSTESSYYEGTVHRGASNGNGKRGAAEIESTATENGADGGDRPTKRPPLLMPAAATMPFMDKASKKLPAEGTDTANASKPTAPSSTQHSKPPKIKTESSPYKKSGAPEVIFLSSDGEDDF
jgi:hypothetical protein